MYKVISLFSGCGGSSQGYKDAGFDIVGSVEFINYQAKNYRNNHSAYLFEEDIRKLNPKEILKKLKIKRFELDILDGSPPCSSFSISGKINKLWGKVKKYSNKVQRTDDLFYEYIRFLDYIKPKVFVAENVSGLIKGNLKGFFKDIFKKFSKCGYNVSAKLLNSKYYEVPQSRQRLFFIS